MFTKKPNNEQIKKILLTYLEQASKDIGPQDARDIVEALENSEYEHDLNYVLQQFKAAIKKSNNNYPRVNAIYDALIEMEQEAEKKHKKEQQAKETHKEETHKEKTHKEEKHKEETHKEKTHKEETHKEETHKEETHKEETHKEEKHKEETHKEKTHKEKTHKEKTHKEETHKEETHKENTHKEKTHKEEKHKEDSNNGCPSRDNEPIDCIVKKDYLKQTLLFHPDKNPTCIGEATRKFQDLQNNPTCKFTD